MHTAVTWLKWSVQGRMGTIATVCFQWFSIRDAPIMKFWAVTDVQKQEKKHWDDILVVVMYLVFVIYFSFSCQGNKGTFFTKKQYCFKVIQHFMIFEWNSIIQIYEIRIKNIFLILRGKFRHFHCSDRESIEKYVHKIGVRNYLTVFQIIIKKKNCLHVNAELMQHNT